MIFRRVFDAVCALSGLLLLSPVFILIALLILWDNGAPVLFSQIRIGRKGRPFRIWKFRTMRVAAIGSSITAVGYARIRPIGAILRRYKLDELPQLFNVLKGDMSLVGPRPEVPEYVRFEMPMWQEVLSVTPGITDLASLLYRDEERLLGAPGDPDALYREHIQPAKLLLNLMYLRTRSFASDLRLIWLSIRYALLPEGFDPDRIRKAFGIGVTNGGYLHSFPSAVDR